MSVYICGAFELHFIIELCSLRKDSSEKCALGVGVAHISCVALQGDCTRGETWNYAEGYVVKVLRYGFDADLTECYR